MRLVQRAQVVAEAELAAPAEAQVGEVSAQVFLEVVVGLRDLREEVRALALALREEVDNRVGAGLQAQEDARQTFVYTAIFARAAEQGRLAAVYRRVSNVAMVVGVMQEQLLPFEEQWELDPLEEVGPVDDEALLTEQDAGQEAQDDFTGLAKLLPYLTGEDRDAVLADLQARGPLRAAALPQLGTT